VWRHAAKQGSGTLRAIDARDASGSGDIRGASLRPSKA